jgi:phytoene dehydrogenase-like protein
MWDAIVIGAGIGGLLIGTRFARSGKRVLILEKCPHIGGTSYIFKRGKYYFPMGPLSFSFPGRVKTYMKEAIGEVEIEFRRNHFQLLTPFLNVVYSKPLRELENELRRQFPEESAGINAFIGKMKMITSLMESFGEWQSNSTIGTRKDFPYSGSENETHEISKEYSDTTAREFLDAHINNPSLRSLLGSQGTSTPEMSMLDLGFMWNVMSEEGIWFPSCGIHGISDLLVNVFKKSGGELRLSSPIKRILVEDRRAVGVLTERNELLKANWVVSNVDHKKTFLELMDPNDVPLDYLQLIKTTPYTDSELCVYLGVDPKKVDLTRMKANHLFYRKEICPSKPQDPEDFDNQEIEICLWSDNAQDSVPLGRVSLILRVSFPYEHFAGWRTGEKQRKKGYREYKKQLAERLIQTEENVLPGLSSSIEMMEIATPLTYEDWGNRFQGSIAGWTWSAEAARSLPGRFLIETPVEHLLMVGIFAASKLFLGGVPTSMHTATLASSYSKG